MNINFVNPYNFIPLHTAKTAAPAVEETGTLSGVIEYSLLTKTPLFIPNTSSDRAFNERLKENCNNNQEALDALIAKQNYHKSYEFFSYENLGNTTGRKGDEDIKPVIPGSSIRGMFRSNYEILTNSCMSVLNEKELSKRVEKKKGNWLSTLTNNHSPCEKGSVCPACRLFGTLNTTPANTTHLRFSDLVVFEHKGFIEPVTLPELSNPKTKNIEFYIQRPSPQAQYWSYESHVDENEIIKDATINGRKFYWHNLSIIDKGVKPGKRNVTIRPLEAGAVFKGKLFFESVTNDELDTLIYLLNAGDSNEELEKKKHGYKLGAAKPLGYGSVAVSVDKVQCRKLVKSDDTITWASSPCKETFVEPKLLDKTIEAEFLNMTSFEVQIENRDDIPISYPFLENSNQGFRWFNENRKQLNNEPHYKYYMQPLNPILQPTTNPSENGNIVNEETIRIGDIVEGKIVELRDYGAFVELPNQKTGMVHVSEVSKEYVISISDHLSVGDIVKVKVIEPRKKGKIALSIKRVD